MFLTKEFMSERFVQFENLSTLMELILNQHLQDTHVLSTEFMSEICEQFQHLLSPIELRFYQNVLHTVLTRYA